MSNAKSFKLQQFIKILFISIKKKSQLEFLRVIGFRSQERIRKNCCILTDLPKSMKHRLLRFSSTLISKLFLQFLTDSSLSLAWEQRLIPWNLL